MWQRRKVNLDLPTQLQLVSPLYPFLSITKVPTVSRSNYTSRSDHASLVCLWRSLLFVFFMENQRGRVDVGKLTQWLPFILCPGSCTLLCQSGSTSFLDLLLLPQHFKIDRNTNLTNILLKITIREEEQIQVSPATQRQSLFVKLHKLNGIKQRSDYHYLHRNISERFQNPRKPLFGFSHTLDTSCQQMHKRSGDKTQELADTPQGSDSLMLRCC